MKTLCVVILLACSILRAADFPKDEMSTFGMQNGRFWNALSDEQRTLFLLGLLDGWRLRGNTEETMRGRVINALTTNNKSGYGDLPEMITSIYANVENVELPAGWVVLGSLAVQRGDTTREAVLMALRKFMGRKCDPCVVPTDVDPLPAILDSRPK